MSDFKINVSYDGKYPNLCRGIFNIKINDKVFETKKYHDSHFNTHGSYERVYFGDSVDWNVVREEYEDGLEFSDWIDELKSNDINGLWSWLNVNFSSDDIESFICELYWKINSVDYRTSSCGGCL